MKLTCGQTVSNLHKQNFDLKLELFHRRQRQSDLEARLEETEARLADQVEMQAINEQLLAELEKRDQAVEEAVGIICNLEEKIERLINERSAVRSFDAQYESGDFRHSEDGESAQDPSGSPPQFNNRVKETPPKPGRSGLAPRSVLKMPSFLSEKSEGTEALRSLYLPSDHSQSIPNLPKLHEENAANEPSEGGMNSPRLSVLSESSFLSVYGEKSLAIEGLDLNTGAESESPPNTQRNRRSVSVEKWVDDRQVPKSAPRRSLSRTGNIRANQFISLNDILESPLQRLEKLHHTLSKSRKQLTSARLQDESNTAECRGASGKYGKEKQREKLKTTELTSYERQHGLPPTPDTISTSTLRRYKASNDTLSREVTERERDCECELGRRISRTYFPTECVRPHSAGETVTSRREGHGWDTVTQSEVTETSSDVDFEPPASIDPWIAMARERSRPRIQPPDMFTFSAYDDEEWGQDAMFNHDSELQLPSQKHSEYNCSVGEDPHSDNTPIRPTRVRRSNPAHEQSRQEHQHQTQNSGFDGMQSPNPPERRSSLAVSPSLNDKKLRKITPSVTTSAAYRPNGAPGTVVAKTQPQNGNKLSGITKLFGLGRSEANSSSPSSATTPKTTTYIPSTTYTRSQTYNNLAHTSKSVGYGTDLKPEELHSASATPPPISRYPRGNNSGRTDQRPMTANSIDSRLPIRRSSVGADDRESYSISFGADGAGDETDEPSRNGKNGGGGTGRKWFNIGRSGSLRR
jgi:hypothetical protein